jgi:sulfopyruvate decarboxylase subunit alpha
MTATAPAPRIAAALKQAGIGIVSSLPDAWLGDLIALCEADPAFVHVKLSREDDGVGICMGAWMGGTKAALVCQSAGVLLSVNMLAAMTHHHQVPMLVLAAYRGAFDDGQYYQLYKGRTIVPVLEAIGIAHYVLDGPDDLSLVEPAARQCFLSRQPLVLLLRRRALVAAKGA